jgi:hypothetical protein
MFDDVHHRFVLCWPAELDGLEILFDEPRVSRRQVEEVAGAEDFLTVRVAHSHLAPNDVAPMWAGAEIVRQPLQKRREVGAGWQRNDYGSQIAPVGSADSRRVGSEENWELVAGRAHR